MCSTDLKRGAFIVHSWRKVVLPMRCVLLFPIGATGQSICSLDTIISFYRNVHAVADGWLSFSITFCTQPITASWGVASTDSRGQSSTPEGKEKRVANVGRGLIVLSWCV